MPEDISKDYLAEAYSKLSTNELLDIVDNKTQYTNAAVTVALGEIGKRNLNDEDIEKHKQHIDAKFYNMVALNVLVELTLRNKMYYYFLPIPVVNGLLMKQLREDGYLLKLKQAKYYEYSSYFYFIISLFILGGIGAPREYSVLLWPLGFCLAYMYDNNFNKQRRIDELQELLDKKAAVVELERTRMTHIPGKSEQSDSGEG